MKKIFYIILTLAPILWISCTKDDTNCQNRENVEISFSIPDFSAITLRGASETRATEAPTADELSIKSIYVFLFSATQPVIKYHTGSPAADGAWNDTDKKVTINQSQNTVGSRNVYVVANYDAALKTALDGVTTLAGLQAALKTAATLPIAADIATTGLLMEGHTTAAHDFTVDNQLRTIPLKRSVAKLQINVTLDAAHQSAVTTDYGYKLLNFGSETWVLEKADAQTINKVLSHTAWQTIPGIAVSPSGKVTAFTLTTYINEYANGDLMPIVEFKLPYDDGGFLPPPEFGDGDMYRLNLPTNIARNTVYKYDITL